jgi:hypothetical protein
LRIFPAFNCNWIKTEGGNVFRKAPMRSFWTTVFLSTMVLLVPATGSAVVRGIMDSKDAVSDSLTFLGHATVKIKTSDGKVIYIDPYQPGDYSDSADVVLVTHQHGDHNQVNMVKKKVDCKIITNADALQGGVYKSFTIGNLTVDAVPAYNSNHSKSSCVGYVVGFNGINLYHAGDTGFIPEMADLAARKLTYALLPMDGIYNMTPEQAMQAAAAIQAANYIPIHTMPPPDTYNDAIVARFTIPNKIVVKNGQTIVLEAAGTSVKGSFLNPSEFELHQNFPNPFNGGTIISYNLRTQCGIRIAVCDALGREIRILLDENQPAGLHQIRWDGTDGIGRMVGSGIYLAQLRTPDNARIVKMLFLR